MNPLHVVVGLVVKAERLTEFHALAAHHAEASRQEPGCTRFEVLRDLTGPCRFQLQETWASPAALELHRQTPHYLRWKAEVSDLLCQPRTHEEYHALHPRRRKVVFSNGCFDLLHAGHVATLEWARQQGDWLIVGLNSDAGVRRLKGVGRPFQPATERARVLRALRCVDEVIEYEEDTPTRLMEGLRPDVLVKGPDYAMLVDQLPGRELVKEVKLAPICYPLHTSEFFRGRCSCAAGSVSGFSLV